MSRRFMFPAACWEAIMKYIWLIYSNNEISFTLFWKHLDMAGSFSSRAAMAIISDVCQRRTSVTNTPWLTH